MLSEINNKEGYYSYFKNDVGDTLFPGVQKSGTIEFIVYESQPERKANPIALKIYESSVTGQHELRIPL